MRRFFALAFACLLVAGSAHADDVTVLQLPSPEVLRAAVRKCNYMRHSFGIAKLERNYDDLMSRCTSRLITNGLLTQEDMTNPYTAPVSELAETCFYFFENGGYIEAKKGQTEMDACIELEKEELFAKPNA